jgi:hydroxypyruvate isomerase
MAGVTRREAITAGGAAALGGAMAAGPARAAQEGKVVKIGKIKQSVSKWCFGKYKLDEFCKICKEIGLVGIDLVGPGEWKQIRDAGLIPTMGSGAGSIPDGIQDPKNHDKIVQKLEEVMPKAAAEGVPNVITFFGNRKGMEDGPAIENSIACLQRCKPIAEANKVTLAVEYLNSRVDHKDYLGDRTPYCVKIVSAVNSPYVKILWDIYHAQIMEGDIIRTIQKNNQWFGHYHTGGNPGRNEIDEGQELNYAAICKAILKTGYTGYVAHEFIPKKADPIKSLRDAAALCDVDV